VAAVVPGHASHQQRLLGRQALGLALVQAVQQVALGGVDGLLGPDLVADDLRAAGGAHAVDQGLVERFVHHLATHPKDSEPLGMTGKGRGGTMRVMDTSRSGFGRDQRHVVNAALETCAGRSGEPGQTCGCVGVERCANPPLR